MIQSTHASTAIRIENLRVENYRALRKIEFKNLTPLTTLLGPNGSGKSTVFDVFAFLSECFESGLQSAWDRRGRAKELKTRGEDGPIMIEIKYREHGFPLITYHLVIDERKGRPLVVEEWLQWRHGSNGRPLRFLDYKEGLGVAASGGRPNAETQPLDIPLKSADLIAVSVLGQLADHPRVAALRDFITNWHTSCLAIDGIKGQSEAGPQERLSPTGDNLANVIQHLSERHPRHLNAIISALQTRIPQLEQVLTNSMPSGQLLLQIKDAPFANPMLARFASDGTLTILAYLLLLHNPTLPAFVGIEAPEQSLHPRLLPELAEECRAASERGQFLLTTHSPFFINALRPEEVRVLYRDATGHTQTVSAADIQGISGFMAAGASLGHLWLEGHFKVGDPLVNRGLPSNLRGGKK